jgi:hypothetical protein
MVSISYRSLNLMLAGHRQVDPGLDGRGRFDKWPE